MAWSEKRGRSWRVRYYRDDGTIGSENGFPTETAARQRVKQIDADQYRGTFIDPVDGRISLAEWVACWRSGCEVSAGTWAKYRNHLDNHILVRFGDTPLTGITGSRSKPGPKTCTGIWQRRRWRTSCRCCRRC